jgi:hypothetical protein
MFINFLHVELMPGAGNSGAIIQKLRDIGGLLKNSGFKP